MKGGDRRTESDIFGTKRWSLVVRNHIVVMMKEACLRRFPVCYHLPSANPRRSSANDMSARPALHVRLMDKGFVSHIEQRHRKSLYTVLLVDFFGLDS